MYNFEELAKEMERAGVDTIEISGDTADSLIRPEAELGFRPRTSHVLIHRTKLEPQERALHYRL